MTTTSPRRSFKEQMHQAREEAIVSAAGRLLGEKGFEAMTLDEVATEVGIAKASLYKHFVGKDELCTAAMAQVVVRFNDFLSELPASLPALERLRALLCRSVEMQLTDKMPVLLSRNSGLAGPLRDCEAYQATLQQVRGRLAAWVEEAQHAGQLRTDLPTEVLLCALLARAADPLLTMLRECGTYSDEQIKAWAVDIYLAGLTTGSAPGAAA